MYNQVVENYTCPDCRGQMNKTYDNDPRDTSTVKCKCTKCGNTHYVFPVGSNQYETA